MAKSKQFKAIEAPPVNDPAREDITPKEAKNRVSEPVNRNDEEPRADRLFTVSSRDRWPDSNIAELNRDAMEIDGSNALRYKAKEDEDAEETVEPGKMKVAELREALDAAGVDYETDANKARLVELYTDYLSQ